MMTCSDESREEVQPGFLLDVENEVPMHAYPAGPSSLRELFQWPSQLLDRMLLHPLGQTLRANLQQAFNHGLLVSTDYSGYGSPEIALRSIASALQAPPEALTFWRASDVLPQRKKMLMTGEHAPLHVFGDVLKQRVNSRTRKALTRAHAAAASEFTRLVAAGTKQSQVAADIGRAMMTSLHTIMQNANFDLGAKAWCYQCNKMCPVHAPSLSMDQLVTRINIAGTTCTSWSSMGRKKKWLSQSTLVFLCGRMKPWHPSRT